ncbi:ARP7 (YPR034W) [Zygosaccharomyces parabailii]|nr:ARP7 (YPR034W) [Zygosaccharomyces parabailii]
MTNAGKKCVVIHNGSSQTIAGFSNRETPQCILPSSYIQNEGEDRYLFGTFEMLDEAQKNKPNANVYTIMDTRGLPYNWDALEAQWKYIYQTHLKTNPEELPLVISVPASSAELDMKVIEKYFELAFVKLKVPTMQIVVEPLAIALSMSKSSALVLDMGARGCRVTPIIDGTVVKSGVMRSKFAGDFLDFQVTELLKESVPLADRSCSMWYNSETWVQQFKATMLQVCDKNLVELERFHEEQAAQLKPVGFQQFTTNSLTQTKNFLQENADGIKKTITLQLKDCYKLPEYLFQPQMASSDFAHGDGITELMSRSIRKTGASVSAMGTPSGGGNGASLTLNERGTAQANSGSQGKGTGSQGTGGTGTAAASGISPEQVYSLLLTNVIITGSTSLLQGMEQRIVNELSIRFPQYKLTTYANQILMDRKIQSWTAMSSMANLPGWELGHWFSLADYELLISGGKSKKARQ